VRVARLEIDFLLFAMKIMVLPIEPQYWQLQQYQKITQQSISSIKKQATSPTTTITLQSTTSTAK